MFWNCATGKLECEDLLMEECAFLVSSSSARCVLEKPVYVEQNFSSQQLQSSLNSIFFEL
jgi:hypothetical protein